jgi:hypothetical protein
MDYKKLSIGLGFVVAFLAGCVVHDVVRVAPPARAGVPLQRWEYACGASPGNMPNFEALANANGALYWELVHFALLPSGDIKASFKRPTSGPPTIAPKSE